MRIKKIALILILLSLLAACEEGSCTSTDTAASEGAVLDLADLQKSSVLEATLTSGDAPLPDKRITFYLDHDEQSETIGSASTGSDGKARFDLKKSFPTTLVQVLKQAALQDASLLAEFDGDSTYCSSSDTEQIKVVK